MMITALAFGAGVILGAIGAMIWGGVIVTRSTFDRIETASDIHAKTIEVADEVQGMIDAARRMRGLGPQAPVVRLRDVSGE